MSARKHHKAPEPQIGDTIGSYRIEALLGEGGMGRVFKAIGSDGHMVAIKLVKSDLAKEHLFQRRFEREAAVAARIVHPNVVRVLDTGQHEGIPYMAQEYIEGGSLQDELVRKGPAQLDTAVGYCAGIAAGLEAVHEAGLIHRDLKPGNILLDGQGTVKITDFGLVKDFDATVLTAPGQAVGSMDYMAPEQIRGADVTPQTDVYALGCVMCDLLTGKPPFADRQGMQILYAHLEDVPPDPCATRPELPAGVGRLIGSALEKEPEKRPRGVGEFARMLEQAASGES